MSSTQMAPARGPVTLDGFVIGLGSMIGAGVCAAFTPAATAPSPCGPGLLPGLVVAAVVQEKAAEVPG